MSKFTTTRRTILSLLGGSALLGLAATKAAIALPLPSSKPTLRGQDVAADMPLPGVKPRSIRQTAAQTRGSNSHARTAGRTIYASAGKHERRLKLYNTHTRERIDIPYARDGKLIRANLAELNRFLRDHYDGSVRSMDPRLIDTLYRLQRGIGGRELSIISAYRSPSTNAMLRRRSRGVAKNSYHVRGQATDLRAEGVSTRRLRNVAKALRRGGVGYYPRSRFIHVDSGPVRYW